MRRIAKTARNLLVLIALAATIAAPASAQDALTADATDPLHVYATPGAADAATTLPAETTVYLEARSPNGAWVLVHTADRATRGWVQTSELALPAGLNFAGLTVISDPANVDAAQFDLYAGPGISYPALETLPRYVRLVIEGRDFTAAWLLVHTPNGAARGWIETRHVALDYGVPAAAYPFTDVYLDESAPAVEPSVFDLYAGPGTTHPVETTIPAGIQLVVEGRDDTGAWLLVHAQDGATRGWIATDSVTLGEGMVVASLPVIGDEPLEEQPVEAAAAQPQEQPAAAPAEQPQEQPAEPAEPPSVVEPPPYQPSNASLDAIVNRLYGVPVVPTWLSARTREIFRYGQQAGMRADVFSKIGDCQTADLSFMLPLGDNEYDLGPYGALQSTIDYFSATSPRAGVPNSFVNASLSAVPYFTAAGVLDPTWATPDYCQPGESPLACEYRVVRPGIAIIMLGTMDVTVYGPETFDANMRRVVNETISRGIVPVLTTFPSHPDRFWEQSLQFNAIILDIAQDENIPVINFWLASRALPNYGLKDDNLHLSGKGERRLSVHGPNDRWIAFNGEEQVWGHTLRNLVTLQTLDMIRRSR
jgi:uncharacterized protein YraI